MSSEHEYENITKRKKKWLPYRCDVVSFDGTKTIMDIGPGAEVTVTIKGPYVDLKLYDVEELRMQARDKT